MSKGSASKGSGPEFSRDPRQRQRRPRKHARPKYSAAFASALPCLALGRPGRPAEQAQNSRGGEQKFGIARCGLPAQAEVLLRPDEGVARGADVHAGVVQDEVVERHELPLGPEGGAGFRGIGSGEDAGADGRGAQPLVEAGESIVGGRQRPDEVGERFVAKRKDASGRRRP